MAEVAASATKDEPAVDQHWLIWDGECGFCRKSVSWFSQHDTNRLFRVTTYQGCPTPPMTLRLREESAHALQVVTSTGDQLSGGRGVLFALEQIGWHPQMARIASKPPFVWAIDLGYRIVANNRQLFSRLLFRSQQTDGPSC